MQPVLRKGDKSDAVINWQNFLAGQGFSPMGSDGVFGKDTLAATIAFQKKYKLEADGVVGNDTYSVAGKLGFPITADSLSAKKKESANFPPAPIDFGPTNAAKRDAEFGSFNFTNNPPDGKRVTIDIKPTWEEENIVTVEVPALAKALDKTKARAKVHKNIQDQFLGLWQAWDDAGLIHLVLTWEGAFYPRYVIGVSADNVKAKNRNSLSNHAWGTAFDINYEWNQLGKIPALVGQKGSVRELVPLANKFGFFWGGHFKSRLDGMHFEWGKKV